MNTVKKLWMNATKAILMKMFKDDDESKIDEFLKMIAKRDFKDREVVLYNSYELEYAKTDMSNVIDFIEEVKPILTENGTLFRRHELCKDYDSPFFNPMKDIIYGWLLDRYKLKEKMLEYKGVEGMEDAFIFYNLSQNNKKAFANGDYGAGGNQYYHMFDANCANAITAKARALLSVAMTTFEDFLRDSMIYFDMNELLDSLEKILSEEKEWRFRPEIVLERDIDIDDVIVRYRKKMNRPQDLNEEYLRMYLSNLTENQLKRLYYKNNFLEFIELPKVKQLLKDIFYSADEFNNPYKVPDEMQPHLLKFTMWCKEFIHFNHILMDKQYRLDKAERKAIAVMDTDSVMINLRQHMLRIYQILGLNVEEIMATDKRRLKLVNLMASVLSDVVDDKLQKFNTHNCNVDLDAPGETTLKNEFLFDILITTEVKKKYIALIRMQEGKVFEDGIHEFKNTDFTKPSAGGKLTREMITKLVDDEFLNYSIPNVFEILKKVDEISFAVEENIDEGKIDFMKTASIKTESSYADPMGEWRFKAAYLWNQLVPEEHIEFPNSVTIVNTKIASMKDLAPIADVDMDMFNRFRDLFEKESKRHKERGVKSSYAINSIAIPRGSDIPPWLRCLVDKQTIISTNLEQINPYMQFGLDFVYKTSTNKFISNIQQIG